MDKAIYPATTWISIDEPCYWLGESYKQSPGSKGFHRYQVIHVIRNDRLAEYVTDMGPAHMYKGIPQFNQIVAGYHTVGECMDIATEQRNGLGVKPRERQPKDLWGEYALSLEEKEKRKKNLTTVGAYVTVQRD